MKDLENNWYKISVLTCMALAPLLVSADEYVAAPTGCKVLLFYGQELPVNEMYLYLYIILLVNLSVRSIYT